MNELGICKRSGRLYEGNSSAGIAINYHVPLMPIELVGVEMQQGRTSTSMIFREDSFDPITKIRRGRVYTEVLGRNDPWHVHDFGRTDLKRVGWDQGEAQELEATSYNADSLTSLRQLSPLPKVILGKSPHHTYWKILSIETQFDGKPLLTLKAMTSFGAVPELMLNQVPEIAQTLIQDALENVEIAANRIGAIETVDACRNALSIVLGTLADNLELELGQGINHRIKKNQANAKNSNANGQDLIIHSAEIVRRLHPRGKSNEKEKHKTRPVSQEDANLALNCLWFVLVELGWARG
ncbi:hypothetical protein [Neptunicella marina]|uniref:Uncharacterized protein n=1 Tax=Neptunicella marina TaxID=2125989 RepID=A0A8J6IWP3_9ALTE|nr:hypothetical protein [Neptunicella marina]MBC3766980.1 hypothetical protein [Neptunicella marina]